MTRAKDISKILTDANISGTLDVSGSFTSQGIDDNADATAITITSAEKVGIGEVSPQSKLHIKTADASATAESGSALVIEGTDATRADLQFLGDAGAFQAIYFGDNSDADIGRIAYSHTGNSMRFTVNASERMRIDSSGNVAIGGTTGITAGGTPSLTVGGGSGNPSINLYGQASSTTQFNFSDATSGAGAYAGFILYGHDDNRMTFGTASTERMRIDSSGNIGLGLSSPQKLLHLKDGDIVVGNGTASNNAVIGRIGFSTDASNSRFIGIESFRGSDAANGDLRFHTFGGDGNNGERIRIFGGGNTTFNTTNQSPAEGTAVGARIGTTGKVQLSSASSACLQINRSDNNGDILVFRRGGTVCGEITVNGDSQTTAYQTSSDYRLKENVTYDFDATARLKQLKPCRFNFISNPDNTTVDGFLAHEVSSIVPEAIGGEKDGTQELDNVVLNSDGTVNSSEITEKDWVVGKEDKTYADDTTWVASKTVPKYQGIDQAKLVPLLVKTIQELEARITALEGE